MTCCWLYVCCAVGRWADGSTAQWIGGAPAASHACHACMLERCVGRGVVGVRVEREEGRSWGLGGRANVAREGAVVEE